MPFLFTRGNISPWQDMFGLERRTPIYDGNTCLQVSYNAKTEGYKYVCVCMRVIHKASCSLGYITISLSNYKNREQLYTKRIRNEGDKRIGAQQINAVKLHNCSDFRREAGRKR